MSEAAALKRLHIVGRKGHGKTSLIVELVEYLTAQGLKVGTIKHTSHRHQIDTPGKDSYAHRAAGAHVVGILSPSTCAAFWDPSPTNENPAYESFAPLFADCDLVLVEGHLKADAPKIEVWRTGLDTTPLAREIAGVLAVVSDDPVEGHAPVLRRADIAGVARWILNRLSVRATANTPGIDRPAAQ